MWRSSLALILAFVMLPASLHAASIEADRSLEITESPVDNAYVAGGEVRILAPLPADLLAAAGTLRVFAPVAGDAFLLGGTVEVGAPVAGDVRTAGGHITVTESVAGDLAAFGGFVRVVGTAGNINVAGGTIELLGGARGPVTAYGGSVTLSGEFAGNVHVVASDRITIAEGTIIRGVLEYNAPQEAGIPESADITGGIRYVGSAAFLPTAEEAQAYALAGIGIFLVVRVIAAMLAAGLVTGLFPTFSRRLTNTVLDHSFQGFMRVTIIGLGIMLLTPLLIFLLLVSFVGIGLAALTTVLYALLLILAYLFAAAILGSAIARFVFKRTTVLWHDAALGMLVLYLIGLIPVIGFLVAFILSAATLGAIFSLFQTFAFGTPGSNEL